MPTRAQVLAFIRLSRLKFLTGGILGFALGAAVARADGYPITPSAYAHGQIMVSAFHLMVHYANDYFDRLGDARAQRTPWSGGSGALLDGRLAPRVALYASLACAVVGMLAAAGFAREGNGGAATVGAWIGALAWSYSAPPLRLLARGWGEIDTAVIVAVLFPLAGYVIFAHDLSLRLLVSTLPACAAMLVLMFCVEYPDVEVDREAGKMNLVARLGRDRGRVLVYAGVAGIYAAGVAAIALGATLNLAYFLTLTIPLAWGLCAQLRCSDLAAPALSADVAARGVALFVATMLGSTLAYVTVTF